MKAVARFSRPTAFENWPFAVPGLKVYRVATIDDALNALQALREKRTPQLC